jgi:hypothetical protein
MISHQVLKDLLKKNCYVYKHSYDIDFNRLVYLLSGSWLCWCMINIENSLIIMFGSDYR